MPEGESHDNLVVVCGFGELGQTVANMLEVPPPFPCPARNAAAAGAPATMLCHPLAPSVRAALQPQWRCGPGVSRRCVVSSEGCGCSQSPLAVTADSKQPTYIGFDLQPNRIQVTGGGVVQPGAFRCNAVTRPGSRVRMCRDSGTMTTVPSRAVETMEAMQQQHLAQTGQNSMHPSVCKGGMDSPGNPDESRQGK